MSVPTCVTISKLCLKVKMVETQTAWQWCESAELSYDDGKYDKIGFDEVS
jgi:hypothetical protein